PPEFERLPRLEGLERRDASLELAALERHAVLLLRVGGEVVALRLPAAGPEDDLLVPEQARDRDVVEEAAHVIVALAVALAQQALPLHEAAGVAGAAEVGDGRGDVDLRGVERPRVLEAAVRRPEDQRDGRLLFVERVVVDERAVLAERLAVVAEQDEERVVEQAAPREALDDQADDLVGAPDRALVALEPVAVARRLARKDVGEVRVDRQQQRGERGARGRFGEAGRGRLDERRVVAAEARPRLRIAVGGRQRLGAEALVDAARLQDPVEVLEGEVLRAEAGGARAEALLQE